MYRHDQAALKIASSVPAIEDDRPVDMIWILRGGGTDVYTLISKLARLQQLIPDNHLCDSQPYILADSAGAYPGSGLVVPNPVDPTRLPDLFKRNINRYLSKDRAEADAALIEEIGPLRLRDTALPVCISAVEITKRLQKAYFRNFPIAYAEARNGMSLPDNANSDVRLSQAVLASSAFAAFLGDFIIDERRFMDMAFIETHAMNITEFAIHHRLSCPDRRLVGVIFGNIYKDFRLAPGEKLNLKGLNAHFPDALRTVVQDDIVQLMQSRLGAGNVFDLSMYVEQPFAATPQGPRSHAFRSDPLAIRERMQWTDAILDHDLRQQIQLEELASLIRRRAMPQVSLAPRIPVPVQSAAEAPPLNTQEMALSLSKDYRIAGGLMMGLARDYVMPVLRPVIERGASVAQSGNVLLQAGLDRAGQMLSDAWERAAPRMAEESSRALDFLLTGSRPKRQDKLAKPLLPSRSSEPRTPSESGHMPL